MSSPLVGRWDALNDTVSPKSSKKACWADKNVSKFRLQTYWGLPLFNPQISSRPLFLPFASCFSVWHSELGIELGLRNNPFSPAMATCTPEIHWLIRPISRETLHFEPFQRYHLGVLSSWMDHDVWARQEVPPPVCMELLSFRITPSKMAFLNMVFVTSVMKPMEFNVPVK